MLQNCYFGSDRDQIISCSPNLTPTPLKITKLNLVLRGVLIVVSSHGPCSASLSKMAFRSRVSPILRSSLNTVRTAVTRRALTSQSKQGASSFRFAGPLLIGASAATAGLFAANQLYNNNFSLIGNVHAATKVRHLGRYLTRF